MPKLKVPMWGHAELHCCFVQCYYYTKYHTSLLFCRLFLACSFISPPAWCKCATCIGVQSVICRSSIFNTDEIDKSGADISTRLVVMTYEVIFVRQLADATAHSDIFMPSCKFLCMQNCSWPNYTGFITVRKFISRSSLTVRVSV
jgi:hypothetical protein